MGKTEGAELFTLSPALSIDSTLTPLEWVSSPFTVPPSSQLHVFISAVYVTICTVENVHYLFILFPDSSCFLTLQLIFALSHKPLCELGCTAVGARLGIVSQLPVTLAFVSSGLLNQCREELHLYSNEYNKDNVSC